MGYRWHADPFIAAFGAHVHPPYHRCSHYSLTVTEIAHLSKFSCWQALVPQIIIKGIGSVYKRHLVTKFEHGVHGASNAEERQFNQ